MKKKATQGGFTLIEIVAVLTLLGILSVVAIFRYMELIEETKNKAVMAQVAEISGRLKVVDAGFQLSNSRSPANGRELLTFATSSFPSACPENSTVEGDFTLFCLGDNSTKTVTISFSRFQTNTFSPVFTAEFSF